MSKLQYTALGNIPIYDKLLGMACTYLITPDVATACSTFTHFKFDPRQDKSFHQEVFWNQTFEDVADLAKAVNDKFNRWYRTAEDLEKVIIGIGALTDSSEQLDNIVNDAFTSLNKKHAIKMIDADGTHFEAADYPAMINDVDFVINARVDWWCRRFEEQVRRVIEMPTMPFHHLRDWYEKLHKQNREIVDRIRNNFYTRHGVKAKHARRLFNRSHKFFIRKFGDNTARKFLRGEALLIHGTHFIWKLKLVVNVFHDTVRTSDFHTPFKITLCNQQMNKLANACVLFINTPPLDQAVNFALYVTKPEDEIDFAKTANFFGVTEIGRQNDLLMSMPHVSLAAPFRMMGPGDEIQYQPPYPQCSTVDDGWAELERDYSTREEYLLRYYLNPTMEEYGPDIQDDDYARAFSSEYGTESLHEWTSEAQQECRTELEQLWRIENRVVRRANANNPVRALIREKIMAKLDVDEDILHYMMFPELHFCALLKISNAPLLEGYIGAKVPLRERNFNGSTHP